MIDTFLSRQIFSLTRPYGRLFVSNLAALSSDSCGPCRDSRIAPRCSLNSAVTTVRNYLSGEYQRGSVTREIVGEDQRCLTRARNLRLPDEDANRIVSNFIAHEFRLDSGQTVTWNFNSTRKNLNFNAEKLKVKIKSLVLGPKFRSNSISHENHSWRIGIIGKSFWLPRNDVKRHP